MRKIFIVFAAALIMFSPASSSAFSSKGSDCTKCHTLKKDEAENLLKSMLPNAKVLEIKPAPVKSMWEVDVNTNNKNALVYIDFSKKYLFSGSIIDIQTKKNISQERFSELNKVNVSEIPLKDAIIMGDPKAKHRIIVFDDPDCPFCSKLQEEMKKVTAERKDIAFYIKMFPLPMHKEAYEKAKSIVCEKKLSALDDAFARKQLPKATCKSTAVDDNLKLGKKLGISGTPALIMPDGRVVSGYKDANAIKEMIDKTKR